MIENMTPEEMEEFKEFRAMKTKQEKETKHQENICAYKQLIDEIIQGVFPKLLETSAVLSTNKSDAFNEFATAIEMKKELYNINAEQRSHTFTNSAGTCRIMLGQYVTDSYDDTVNEGVAKVKEYISSLAKDTESKMLVDGILKLLSKDNQGNLKASRVIQLRKMADESDNDTFKDGVKIITEAYRPATSSQYIRAEYKNEQGAWVNVPLGMTEA